MKVTEARPLEELVNALSERYGWILDYEDPVYSDSEVKDDTDPAWRASHPTAAGTNSPKGISFAATLPQPGEDSVTRSLPDLPFLSRVVSDYQLSGNPGKFIVLPSQSRRVDTVGITTPLPDGILGTQVDMLAGKKTAAMTIANLLTAVSQKSGVRIEISDAPTMLLMNTQIELPRTVNTQARVVLASILDQTGVALRWTVIYDYDQKLYLVRIDEALRVYIGAAGQRVESRLPFP